MANITIDLSDDLYDEILSFLEGSELTIEEFIIQIIERELQKQKIQQLIDLLRQNK